MPLFSEHIANMYYGSSSPYTGLPYSYSSSSISPLGSSYSASYLNPGSNYTNHSSLGGYSRAPLSSRWITSSGRNYAPMLSTISERGSASPVRISSPRRIPYSSRTYGTPTYTPRPVNINTADIDVSRDKYSHKVEPPAMTKPEPVPEKEISDAGYENGPFMPRVDGKPETGIDSSPGTGRSTIKRGRTVVRLYTIKRNSPRKPNEESQTSNVPSDSENVQNINEATKTDEKEFMKWREKLSDDLTFKDKKEKKTLGAKLVEKFIVKDEKVDETPIKVQKLDMTSSQSLPATPAPNVNFTENKSFDRRCSMELLAEQANLLDSLIRSENLSTATLDLSKVGIDAEPKNNIEPLESTKRRKPDNSHNPLKTTKSDHSLHDSLNSYKDVRDPRNFGKRRSIKKSASGSSIRRLDSITEFPKEASTTELPAIDESRISVKNENSKQKPKPKLKAKITTSVEVEVSAPMSPLKFRVENVTVEEKPRKPKKEIIYSSEVVNLPTQETQPIKNAAIKPKEINSVTKPNKNMVETDLSPDPDDGNFWDKIGKRETVYLIKRKQNLEEAREKHKRALFWFPEEEEGGNSEDVESKNMSNNISSKETDLVADKQRAINEDKESKQLPTVNKNLLSKEIEVQSNNDISEKQNTIEEKLEKVADCKMSSENITVMDTLPSHASTKLLDKETSSIQKDNVKRETICEQTISSKECKNIGKSSSLDAIDENKNKKSLQKKTKSEKTKKTQKNTENIEPKSSHIPKVSTKGDTLNKLEAPKKMLNICDNCKTLEQSSVLTDNVKNDAVSNLMISENYKKVDDLKTVPQQQVNEPIKTNLTENQEKYKNKIVTENDLIGTIQVEEKSDDTLNANKVPATSTTATNASSKTIEQKVETKSNESKALDLNKNLTKPQKSSLDIKATIGKAIQNNSEVLKIEAEELAVPSTSTLLETKGLSMNKDMPSNSTVLKLETSISNQQSKTLPLITSPVAKLKPSTPSKSSSDVGKIEKTEDIMLKPACEPLSEKAPVIVSNNISASLPSQNNQESRSRETNQLLSGFNNKEDSSTLNEGSKTLDVPNISIVVETQDIPKEQIASKTELSEQKTGEDNKAENIINKDEQSKPVIPTLSPKRPVKEEKALRPLIATPRPLQKRSPQVIHSSDSSDSSSEEDSSDEDDDDESDASEDSAEFYECENNPDGRTSTGSNDSGFDSSAPTSPATFSQIKKDCDVNCHRKCEKLTANLCGVNQRLLVEALASRTASRKGGEASGPSSSAAPGHGNNTDIVEQELEQSTAYDIFKKTGRFTPPARSIPRFRKYTVEDFHFIKVLGKGSFGKVLLAELRDTEYYYAVKCLKKDVVLEDDDVECTLIERKVLALGTNHPYLCHLFATFQTDSHLFFVMEYLNGGDLMFHIQQSGRFPEARARFYAAEIVSGLKFLHKRGIVYRDLKLDNILLDFEGHVRIADFGMCKLQIYLDKTADTFCGTPDYMAPEIIKGLKYNQTVDWWSFGVLLYEMLIGQSPFSGCDEDELFWSICNEMPSYPRFLSHEALTILTRLLDKDARTRLGGTECMHGDIRDQDFFHQIHWDRLERRDLEAPFRPRVRHPMDTQYFDRAFTGERPRLTAVESHVLRSMDQEPFRGFSYTNPNTTDR